MKLKGQNFFTEPIDEIQVLDNMFTGFVEEDDVNGVDVAEVEDAEKKLLTQLEDYFKNLVESCKVNPPQLSNLVLDENGRIVIPAGMACHKTPAKDDRQNLLERLSSISQNGLLACEWFGIRYSINEVPFKVSFHRMVENLHVQDIEIPYETIKNSKMVKLAENDGIYFFVDINNPFLQFLVSSDIAKSLNRELSKKHFVFNDEKFYVQDAISEAENAVENLRKSRRKYIDILKKESNDSIFLIKFDLQYSRVPKQLQELIFGEALFEGISDKKYTKEDLLKKIENGNFDDEAIEKFVDAECKKLRKEKFQSHLKLLKSDTEYFGKYYSSIYAGVPSQFVNGVFVPNHLKNDGLLIDDICKLFPRAVVFGGDGKVLGGKTNVISSSRNK